MEQNDALLRYYFKADPDLMDDEKYCRLTAQLQWIAEKRKGSIDV